MGVGGGGVDETVEGRVEEMKKPVMAGGDYLRDKNWKPIIATREQAERIGWQKMAKDLKRCNFNVVICDCGDYYRINYAK